MDFPERAKIRIEHWLKHNESHIGEYEQFAEQLEAAGMQNGAGLIREMIVWTAKGNDCLHEALKTITDDDGTIKQRFSFSVKCEETRHEP
jgi:hypothetical protein